MAPELNHSDYHPIGTVGYIHGIKIKVMPGERDPCRRCAFVNSDCIGFLCSSWARKDSIPITFKRIE